MNKVAFITGAGGYIGGETAVTLAKQVIKIAVCDINTETVEKTVKRITEIGGTAKGYVFDVTDSQSVNDTVDKIVNVTNLRTTLFISHVVSLEIIGISCLL